MRKLLLFALVTLVSLAANAQNSVTINNLRYTFKERRQPENPLNPKHFAYATSVKMHNTVKAVVEKEVIDNLLIIEGQELMDAATAQGYLLSLSLSQLNGVVTTVKEKFVKIGNKNGRGSRTEKRFWIEVTYDMSVVGKLTKGDALIRRYDVKVNGGEGAKMTYQSEEFITRKEVTDFWDINRDDLKDEFILNIVTQKIKTLSSLVSGEFGYPVLTHNRELKTIKDVIHPENAAMRENTSALKDRLETLDGTTPLTEQGLSSIIEYFKDIPSRYSDEKLKGHMQMRYIAYYNLTHIYLALDMPEKAEKWADLMYKNDYDKKDATLLLREADKLQIYLYGTDEKIRQFIPTSYSN